MTNLQETINTYLDFCKYQKRLDDKTIKSYRIDLTQFLHQIPVNSFSLVSVAALETFISTLHQTYKPKTVKRKIASVKALFHYLEYRDIIQLNPFNKMQIKFREPSILPKIIPLSLIETLLSTMYKQNSFATTEYQRNCLLRDTVIIELLFATGMRISELCSLKPTDVCLNNKEIFIYGKGAKERKIQIENDDIISILDSYKNEFCSKINDCGYFFVNKFGHRLSEQSVRTIINKYTSLAAIDLHITPHMFRHSFATYLLEADVDIRYIQEMLGHSSINVTQIYTHVSAAKQRDILASKHPRKNFKVN